MSNAILRAGPYAQTSSSNSSGFLNIGAVNDSFVNKPGTPNVNTYPVNCNINSTSNWIWQVSSITDAIAVTQSYISVTGSQTSVSQNFTASNDFLGEGLFFCYQAVNSFTLSGTYSASSTKKNAGSEQNILFFTIRVAGSTLLNDSDVSFGPAGGSASISDSFSVTLPAAVKPAVAELQFGTDFMESCSGSITINNIVQS